MSSDLKLKFEKYMRHDNKLSTSEVVTPEFGASIDPFLKDNESIGSGPARQFKRYIKKNYGLIPIGSTISCCQR